MKCNQQDGVGTTDYREVRPSAKLAQHLICIWTQTVNSRTGLLQRVLPDCCVDVLLMNETPVVVGPWTKPFVARLSPGTRIIGARLYPGVAPSILNVPASELLDRLLPLADVFASCETAPFARVVEERTLSGQILAMEGAILGRVANAGCGDSSTRASIRWIARHPRGRVEQLSKWLGLSSRQVQRRFTTAVGYGPKTFQSVLRFQRLLRLASSAGVHGNLAQFAADAEYADQAHMTREVQRFSGEPPSLSLPFSRCTLGLSDLIKAT